VKAVALPAGSGRAGGRWRSSGIVVESLRYVADVHWNRAGTEAVFVRRSVTRSQPPVIANLRADVFPGDRSTCGTEFPDRVLLTFDYQDCNGDVLGGRVAVNYDATLRDPPGFGPITGGFQCPFFPPNSECSVSSATDPRGTATVFGCFRNVRHFEFAVRLRDADNNLAPQTLTLGVDMP
jgi:hypothetical protein